MRCRDRVVGVEIGVRGVTENADRELRVLRMSRDGIDDRMRQATCLSALLCRRRGDPSPVGEEAGFVLWQPQRDAAEKLDYDCHKRGDGWQRSAALRHVGDGPGIVSKLAPAEYEEQH